METQNRIRADLRMSLFPYRAKNHLCTEAIDNVPCWRLAKDQRKNCGECLRENLLPTRFTVVN